MGSPPQLLSAVYSADNLKQYSPTWITVVPVWVHTGHDSHSKYSTYSFTVGYSRTVKSYGMVRYGTYYYLQERKRHHGVVQEMSQSSHTGESFVQYHNRVQSYAEHSGTSMYGMEYVYRT